MSTSCSSCGGQDSSQGGSQDAGLAMQDELIKSTLAKIRYKLFVMSGKGGVGKSSVAVNLAAGLAAMGKKVGLMDVDIHGPSVANLLALEGGLEVHKGELFLPKKFNENLSAVSMDTLLKDRDQAVLWRGPMKHSAIRQFIADVMWGELDFLVIDSPPGTGDEHMTVLKTIPDALCLIVTTPQEVSLADVRKAINFLQYAQANVLGVVENMSGLICPHCKEEISLFKKGGGKELAYKYGLPFLGAVPLDPATVVASDLGKPVVLMDEDFPAKKAFLDIARKTADAAESSLEIASTIHT
ncbi:MAG: Mrp/NBP35 family ATP-binding protein [Oceanidesulfovibrio sp.]